MSEFCSQPRFQNCHYQLSLYDNKKMFKAQQDECKLIGYVQNSVRYIELHLNLRSIQNYYSVDLSFIYLQVDQFL